MVQNLIGNGAEIMARGLDKNAEFEADRVGMIFAARAGYDPWGLPDVLQDLAGLPAKDSRTSLLYKTHPHPADRLAALGEAVDGRLDAVHGKDLASAFLPHSVKHLPPKLAQAGLSALFVVLIALHVAGLVHIAPMQRAEAWLYDVWLKRTAPSAPDDRVAILDIDEASLKSVGRWPWSRDTMTALVEQLFDHYGVAAVGFDVVFAEPDTSSGLDTLKQLAQRDLAGSRDFQAALGQLTPRLDYDARFARALAERPISLGYYFIPAGYGDAKSGLLPAPSLPATAFSPLQPGTPPPTGYGANLAAFQNAAQGAGFFNMRADADGTARQMNLVTPFGAGYYQALSASTLRVAFGGEPTTAGVEQSSLLGRQYTAPWLEVGGIRVPLSADGTVHVPYRAGSPFPYLSAAQVLAGKAPLAQLENRIVLVGSTAPGLADLRVTPFSNTFPGVEIHAHLIAGMLDGTTRATPPWADDARLIAVLLLGALLTVVLLRFGPTIGLATTLVLLALLLAAYGAAWSRFWVVPMAAPMLTLFGLYALNTAYGFFAETRSKRQITKLFGQYVPPELAAEMSQEPGALHDGRPVARHDRAVLRHPRLHQFFRETAAGRTRRSAECLSVDHDAHRAAASRHHRQIHRRRHHGVLERAGGS